jgi:hypothetical protein
MRSVWMLCLAGAVVGCTEKPRPVAEVQVFDGADCGCMAEPEMPVATVETPVLEGGPTTQTPVVMPTDQAGKLLAIVLPPTRRTGPLEPPGRAAPPQRPIPGGSPLTAVLPAMPAPAPRLPNPRSTPRPQTVTEEAIDEGFDVPMPPTRPPFRPSGPTRESSEDARLAPPLPYLASPPAERVSTADPTLPASTRAVQDAPLPQRTTAIPFVPVGVPEPYEYRQPLQTPIPEEDSTPQNPTPQRP